MLRCFALARKNDPEGKNVKLADIDDEMCALFGVTPDPNDFYLGWYDNIGMKLASGTTFEELRVLANEPPADLKLLRIIEFLDANFTCSTWEII